MSVYIQDSLIDDREFQLMHDIDEADMRLESLKQAYPDYYQAVDKRDPCFTPCAASSPNCEANRNGCPRWSACATCTSPANSTASPNNTRPIAGTWPNSHSTDGGARRNAKPAPKDGPSDATKALNGPKAKSTDHYTTPTKTRRNTNEHHQP